MHRETIHEGIGIALVVAEENQRRQRLVDRDAENLAEGRETGGRRLGEEVGPSEQVGIAQAAQHAVIEQHGQRLPLAAHELLPVALRGGDEIGHLEQVQTVAELDVAEEGGLVGSQRRHRANEHLALD